MKITKIEVIPVKIPYTECVREELLRANPRMEAAKTNIYKVYTDEGIVGIGEGQIAPTSHVNQYIGNSPFDYILDDSAGSLLIAFYDLMGKFLEQPLYKFFGRRLRDKVTVAYWSHCYTSDLLAEEAKRAVTKGFTLHKIKARPFRDPISQALAIAEVVPPEYRIVVDANETFGTPAKTLRIAKEYEKIPQIWALEEPISTSNLEGYRYLRQKLNFPIAIHVKNKITAFQQGTCDAVVLEDIALGRAIQTTTALAEFKGRTVWAEYGLFSGVSATFQVHQAAVIPNLEMCITLAFLTEDDLLMKPLFLSDGYVKVPEKPGLGVELNEDAVDKYRI